MMMRMSFVFGSSSWSLCESEDLRGRKESLLACFHVASSSSLVPFLSCSLSFKTSTRISSNLDIEYGERKKWTITKRRRKNIEREGQTSRVAKAYRGEEML